MSFDLVVRNGIVSGSENPVQICVNSGSIERIGPSPADGDTEIDAGGGLIAGGFVDCHVHLDKALIADSLPANKSGTLREAIENIHARKREYTVDNVRARAEAAIKMHVRNGCTRIRTHVDVDTIGGLTPLKGVVAARESCDDIADVQIVAFPQEGIYQDSGTESLLAESLKLGANVIGGMPDSEHGDDEVRAHVDACLELAEDYNVPVDMHVDETDDPTAKSLEYIASQAIKKELTDVTAGHTCALAAYEENHAQRVVDLVAEAGLKMVTNPPTNLLLQGRHDRHPKRRGITRVDQLDEAGVTVAAGQDCIQDGFYPYGRASMLETALLTAHAAHLQTPRERAKAWDTVAGNAAEIMNVEHGIREGVPAIFNVFPPSIETRTDALRAGTSPQKVVHQGRIVAENSTSSAIKRA